MVGIKGMRVGEGLVKVEGEWKMLGKDGKGWLVSEGGFN